MRGRPHSREFKLDIVRQLASGEKRPAQICREHNLAASMVARWRQEYDLRGEAAFAPVQPTQTEALEAKVAELTVLWAVSLGEHRVKKSLTAASIQDRHAMIDALQAQEKPAMSVRNLCKLLHVNRRWYYACHKPNTRQEVEAKLREAIEQIVQEFAGYGYRRVTHALVRAGWSINHKRVLRVMQEEGLLCRHTRRFVHTTDSRHRYQVYPNLIRGMQVEAPDTVWVADLTYIRLPSTFAYLACVLDAYSRKCVGWKVSKRIDAHLAVDALEMALATRDVSPGLIHHSDRGVQYASTAYVQRLESIGARISMSAVGNPYDNAKAESFFKTVKTEEVYLKQYQSFAEAESNIEQFIEEVYNAKRLHSSLGYLSPVEFEIAYIQGTRC